MLNCGSIHSLHHLSGHHPPLRDTKEEEMDVELLSSSRKMSVLKHFPNSISVSESESMLKVLALSAYFESSLSKS